MTVEFDVDGWGAVKGIQVDCGDEPELSKAVIVALYGLPKFVAGRKDDARVIDHCIFTYAITELFLAP